MVRREQVECSKSGENISSCPDPGPIRVSGPDPGPARVSGPDPGPILTRFWLDLRESNSDLAGG